jgi:hypothetical protein
MSAWIQHVKEYAKKNGVSYKEAMKGASKTYGSGINEDMIRANVAQRKAVAERDEEKLELYGFYLQIYYAIEYLIMNGMKEHSFRKALKNYKDSLNDFEESLPEKKVEIMREQIFENDDGVGFSDYMSDELRQIGIDGKASKKTSASLNAIAKKMRSLIK